jgi:hypothetical protein
MKNDFESLPDNVVENIHRIKPIDHLEMNDIEIDQMPPRDLFDISIRQSMKYRKLVP